VSLRPIPAGISSSPQRVCKFPRRSACGRYMNRRDSRTPTRLCGLPWRAAPISIASPRSAHPQMAPFIGKRTEPGMPQSRRPRIYVSEFWHFLSVTALNRRLPGRRSAALSRTAIPSPHPKQLPCRDQFLDCARQWQPVPPSGASGGVPVVSATGANSDQRARTHVQGRLKIPPFTVL
jgi:hypothetical protein